MKKKLTAVITASALVTGISFSSAQASPVAEVQRGDTLWGIASTYDTSVDRLLQLNDLNSTLIMPNQTLKTQDSDDDSDDDSEEHVVKEGDTLGQIGAKYNVSVEQLKEWNDLNSDLILIGQNLLVQESADNNSSGNSEEARAQAEEEEAQRLEAEQAEQEEQERLEAEQAEQEEQERLEAEQAEQEEQERLEAEQAEQEEQERLEAEQAEQEEQERLEAEQAEQEEQERLEAEQAEQEEQERLEAEQAEQEEQERLEAEQAEQEEAEAATQENEDASGETFTVEATAYTAGCDGCSGITSEGLNLNDNPDKKVIAVDPNVIPLGSTVEVEGYGTAIAGDIGSAIQGEIIDVHVPTQEEAINWGRRDVNVTIVD